MIHCGPHGPRVSAVLCRHLLQSDTDPCGFVQNSDDPHDLQAWCHRCEEKFVREGGMTDGFRDFNGMTIVCVECFGEARQRHLVPTG